MYQYNNLYKCQRKDNIWTPSSFGHPCSRRVDLFRPGPDMPGHAQTLAHNAEEILNQFTYIHNIIQNTFTFVIQTEFWNFSLLV